MSITAEHAAPGIHVPWVAFGPKDHQVVTVEVASMILTAWCSRQPSAFGAYLSEAMTGTKPGRPKP